MKIRTLLENKITSEREALVVVRNNGWLLHTIPAQFKTIRVCFAAVRHTGLALRSVPIEYKTSMMCKDAVLEDGRAIVDVPAKLIDRTQAHVRVANMNDEQIVRRLWAATDFAFTGSDVFSEFIDHAALPVAAKEIRNRDLDEMMDIISSSFYDQQNTTRETFREEGEEYDEEAGLDREFPYDELLSNFYMQFPEFVEE